ncbi:hypothetical protein KEM48_009576 [Puccinia striiformis f. sp. tritici PST-130]|nr:hypothetical protein KEM48_009576 [Puccinia striiformis f. sp. tritici PST-130]
MNREFLAVNENLVKLRMFTVLKRSPDNTMVHADIIKAIVLSQFPGIATPTKDERRRLNRLIDAYIKRGLLERVAIVNLNSMPKLNDLEARTAEQILTRMEREQAPSHLSHVKISSVLETSGREKRVRWFSAQGLKANVKLLGSCWLLRTRTNENRTWGFIDINPSTLNQDFYENATQLYGQTVSEPKGSWGKQVTKKASRVSKQAGGMQGNSLQEKDMEKDYVPEIPLENVPNSLNDSGPTKRVMSERTTSRKRTKLALDPGPPTISAKPSLPEAPNEHPELPTELCCQPSASTLSQHSNQPLPGNSPPPTTGVNEPDASIIPPADTLSSSLKARGTRQNLTTLHREYHLLEAIKFAGGIVEKTNELAKAVRDLVDRADQDQVVTLMDSRTLNCALHGLETRKEIKLTTVLVTDALGASCHRKIIYLPSIPLEGPEMRKWLDDMKVRFKTLDKATEARVSNNPSPLPNALGVNDEALHAAFMNQWRCLSQLYGFILGKAARAKILHLHIMKSFANSSQTSSSRFTISSGHRVFSSGFLFQELPVGVFAKLVPIMAKSEEFETLRASPGAMETPMSNTPLAIRRLFQIGNQFSRVKVYQIVEVLYHLKLIVPLQKSPDVSEYYRIADSGEKFYYSPTQMCTSVGLFCLANAGHVYGFSERSQNPPPVLAKWPLKDEHDGERYWEELKRACIPDPEAPPIKNAVDSVENEKLFNGPPKILQMLTDQSKWRDGIQLTPTQREYVARFDRQTSLTHDLEADDEMISNIAHVLVTVPEAVRQAIRTSREAAALARAKKAQKALAQPRRKKMRKRAPEVDPEKVKLAQVEAARVLSDKAKNALKQKEGDWNSIINRFKTQSNITEIDEAVLQDLHTLFTTNNGVSMPTSLSLTKAKRIKMLKSNLKPRRLKIKEASHPRVFPDKPKKISTLAAKAIRPQPDAQIGLRPAPCLIKPGQRPVPELEDPTPQVPAAFNGELVGLPFGQILIRLTCDLKLIISEEEKEQFSGHPLPGTYDELRSSYRIRRLLPSRRSERWDEFHSLSNSVVREMNVITEAFAASCPRGTGSNKAGSVSHEVLRACEAIKTYSEPIAAAVLSHYPDELLVRATDYLCLKGIIAIGGKLHHKKRLPGRSYCYTDKYLSNPDTKALQDPRHSSMAQLRNHSTPNPNETASLLHAYSRGEVSQSCTFHCSLQWSYIALIPGFACLGKNPSRSRIWDISTFYRTRKLDDHCIEKCGEIHIQRFPVEQVVPSVDMQPRPDELDLVHQLVLGGVQGLTPQVLMEQSLSQIPQDTLRRCLQL